MEKEKGKASLIPPLRNKKINVNNKKTFVNVNTNGSNAIRGNTNDITEDVLRILSKSYLFVKLWKVLPNTNEEPVWYNNLADKLKTSQSALDPLIRKLEDLGLIKRIIQPVKLHAKLKRHYFKKNAKLILKHS
jgi:DNA-binding HxlR family transcriptional regulator